jgi:hypothetical protein
MFHFNSTLTVPLDPGSGCISIDLLHKTYAAFLGPLNHYLGHVDVVDTNTDPDINRKLS